MQVGTVLLLDDEEVVLRVQAAAVRQFGFHAIIANSAEDALKLVEEQEPELIITDVHMPGSGGYDFVSKLDEHGLKTMPVVYLTAHDDLTLISGGLQAGGDDFIIKGGPIDKLRHRIAFWMISGFKGLPAELKRRALISVNEARQQAFGGVEDTLELDHARINTIAEQMKAELQACPAGFGNRLIDRILVMGRMSKLLIENCSLPGDYIRFPDYLRLTLLRLGQDWAEDYAVLFGNFDAYCQDIRFVRAGPVPLKPAHEYDLDS